MNDMQISRQRQELEQRQASTETFALPVKNLTTSNLTLLTVDDDAFFQIGGLTATNTTGGSESFDLYVVPSGGSAGTTNAIIYQKSIATKDIYQLERFSGIAPPGSSLVAKSSATGVNLFLWGLRIASGVPQ